MSQPIRRRVSRRNFIRGSSAATGAVVAGAYVKPSLLPLGTPTAYARVSGPHSEIPSEEPTETPTETPTDTPTDPPTNALPRLPNTGAGGMSSPDYP